MRELRLRHHHLLCVQTFTGLGYDRRFVSNMESVISLMSSDEEVIVHLSPFCDDICSSCPNQTGGRCIDEGSVAAKDRSAADFLGLPEELMMEARLLLPMVRDRLLNLDDLGLVCGDCSWISICRGRLSELRGEGPSRKSTGKPWTHDQCLNIDIP
jgi:hypothetical protein